MFSHPRNKVDMFSLLNEGKIILINTAKDLLGQEGAAIFGRFFIALIAQAAPAHQTDAGLEATSPGGQETPWRHQGEAQPARI